MVCTVPIGGKLCSARLVIACALVMGVLTPALVAQQTRNVELSGMSFSDVVSNNSTSTITAGDTIRWVWVSGTHSTTSGTCNQTTLECTPSGLWDSGEGVGMVFTRVFNTAGTFPYFCSFHGIIMRGTVVVQPAATASTTTAVASSGSPSSVGASVTFTATVTSGGGTPAGNVTFKDGANDLGAAVTLNGSAVATLSTSALTAGTHSITAVYAGNANFSGSTSAAISQVVKHNTTTALSSSANPSVAGDAVTFTATVTSATTATGTVSFRDGGGEIANTELNGGGVATFQTSALSEGGHTITAVYSGDDLHFTSTSAVVDQTVGPALPPVNLQPTALDVGGVVPGRSSSPRTLTLTNGSGASISTATLQITGDFTQTNDCGSSLAAGASCAIAVVFQPQVAGVRTGSLSVEGANTVPLTGTGVEFSLPLSRPTRPPRN